MKPLWVAMITPLCVLSLWSFSMASPRKPANILVVVADDWSWPHASVYGDSAVATPAFDRVASEGMLFTNVFCASPSCAPSRAAMLTGQAPHRLEEGANQLGRLHKRFTVYPDLLEQRGYFVGFTGKGWRPGSLDGTDRLRNPAGPYFPSFEQFLNAVPSDKPFCFWVGSSYPHRPYEAGIGPRSGTRTEDVRVPAFLPDTPEIREDILAYYCEVQEFDREIAAIIRVLEFFNRSQNTLLIVTSDHGMPFPRCKANVYDSGSHVPLAIRWPARVDPGRRSDDFISLTDVAPTLLEAAGMEPPRTMTGKSFLGLLTGQGAASPRESLFIERERHAFARNGNVGYPVRAIRTHEYLYIRNLRPDRGPAGLGSFRDIDDSPSKAVVLDRRDEPEVKRFFELACAIRPAEELYDLKNDPYQITNVADDPRFEQIKKELRAELESWMRETADPRAFGDGDRFDTYSYYPQR